MRGIGMAKETMEEKIARLEHDLEIQKEQNNELLQKLYQMQNEIDKEHDDNVMLREEILKLKIERDQAWQDISSLEIEKGTLQIENKKLMTKDVKSYENEIQKLVKDRNNLLLQNEELRKQKGVRIHNERGAGRKPTMTPQKKQAIIEDRATGMTFKQLSEKHGYSVGIIHKLISESISKE